MKKIFFYFLLLSSSLVKAQTTGIADKLMDQARMSIDPNHYRYNPTKGFALYKAAADSGNARAMNALGILCGEGVGTQVDFTASYEWFKKAAEHGYGNAWYNLAVMQKRGIGTPQNYKLAYESYSKGAEINAYGCLYGKGVMLYKGLGCVQNYDKAIELFKKGAKQRSLGSMYMLGLSYRNGYGTVVKTDSAKFWLNKALQGGYKLAQDELMAKDPENATLVANSVVHKSAKAKKLTSIQKVKNVKPNSSPSGIYKGFLITYDWSGKYVVSQSNIVLDLNCIDSTFTGTWTENDALSTDVKGKFTSSAMSFVGSAYNRVDHYHPVKAIAWQFRDSPMQLLQASDSTYLVGNIQMYSPETYDPGKPMYICLTKQYSKTKNDKSAALNSNTKNGLELQKDAVGQSLIVYPNPFSGSLTIRFTLQKEEVVHINLYDMAGKLVFSETKSFSADKHSHVINPQTVAGNYMLKLQFGNNVQSTIVVKQ